MPSYHSFKRCGCRGDGGRPLDAQCPKLRRGNGSWNPGHGTWFGRAGLPPTPAGRRQELRAGGWTRESDLAEWFDAALALLAIPAPGDEGHDDRVQILNAIRAAKLHGEPLPDYDDVRRRYQHGVTLKAGSTGEYLKDWLDGLRRSDGVKPNTLRGYESHVRVYFIPAFGNVPLDRLRVSHIARMFDQIGERNAAAEPGQRGTSPATMQRILATLRAALGAAARSSNGLLAANVAAQVRLAPGPRAKARPWTQPRINEWRKQYDAATKDMKGDRRRWEVWQRASMRPSPVMVWTPAQVGQFLDAIAGHRLYALYHLITYRGLRRGEACGLGWADVDLDRGRMSIRRSVVQLGWKAAESTPKSSASDGTVALDKDTVKVLRAWRKTQLRERIRWGEGWTDTGLVFTAEDGNGLHPNRVTDIFMWEAFRAGMPPIRLHDLRHGAASLAHSTGADIKAISHMLRHSSIAITADTYTSVFEEADAELAESMSRAVPRSRADSTATDAPTTRPRGR